MRQTNEELIGDILNQWVNVQGYKTTLNEMRIREVWQKVVGESAFEQTQKIWIDKKRLVVFVKSSILRNELIYQKSNIKTALNSFLGEDLIEEISIS